MSESLLEQRNVLRLRNMYSKLLPADLFKGPVSWDLGCTFSGQFMMGLEEGRETQHIVV